MAKSEEGAARAGRGTPGAGHSPARANQRYGWCALFVFMAFGFGLEGLLGVKAVPYLMDPLRHDLWRLAHFHGSLLAVVNLIYAWSVEKSGAGGGAAGAAGAGRLAGRLGGRVLMAGSVLLPLGFFLGGLAHYEGDPGPGIFLVPLGALCVLLVVGREALTALR